jgi:hypothetical protein
VGTARTARVAWAVETPSQPPDDPTSAPEQDRSDWPSTTFPPPTHPLRLGVRARLFASHFTISCGRSKGDHRRNPRTQTSGGRRGVTRPRRWISRGFSGPFPRGTPRAAVPAGLERPVRVRSGARDDAPCRWRSRDAGRPPRGRAGTHSTATGRTADPADDRSWRRERGSWKSFTWSAQRPET